MKGIKKKKGKRIVENRKVDGGERGKNKGKEKGREK